MMGQIVYIQGTVCFNDLVELLLCSEKLVLGLIFSRHISVYFNISRFYIPKYTADVYEAERTCN